MGSEEETKIKRASYRLYLLRAAFCAAALAPLAVFVSYMFSDDVNIMFAASKSTAADVAGRSKTKTAIAIKSEDSGPDSYAPLRSETKTAIDRRSEVHVLLKEIGGRCQSVERPKVGTARDDAELRPIWFAQFQETVSGRLHTELIRTLTGMNSGGKNFYASSPGLKHCINSNAPRSTVTCAVLSTEETTPTTRNSSANRFENSIYIMPLRNPMTSLPFATNYKAIMYHDQVGQMPASNWQTLRDNWFDNMIKKWIGGITVWDDTVYKRAIYVSFEDLMSPLRGPGVLKELSSELSRLGFPTMMSEDDAECAWYGIVGGEEALEPYHNNGQYEYGGYRPGYTEEQREKMVLALEDLVLNRNFNSSGERIKEILVDYIDDIRKHMVIDSVMT
eukprot:CAMPEP_0194270044 /NCGR_PEP_ID=MMETSP0169-20130528/4111_1 /TAXON_ID=218684 /ORGANISM="Corethron pennatum, Strain L29A3" /LENGTH=390 /DNA_ID=CAMNT_0039011943 /DNA_START=107 /DNA_END=1279 /DNA_ORIENTATION=+